MPRLNQGASGKQAEHRGDEEDDPTEDNLFPQTGRMTSDGIILDDPRLKNEAGLTAYAKEMTEEYQTTTEIGERMWSTFYADFLGWDQAAFGRANNKIIGRLRRLLLDRGVWISNHRDLVGIQLYTLTQLEEFPKWLTNIPYPDEYQQIADRRIGRLPGMPPVNTPYPGPPNPTPPPAPPGPGLQQQTQQQNQQFGIPFSNPFSAQDVRSGQLGSSQQLGNAQNTMQPQPNWQQRSQGFQNPQLQQPKLLSTASATDSLIAHSITGYNPQENARQPVDLGRLYTDEMKYSGRIYPSLEYFHNKV